MEAKLPKFISKEEAHKIFDDWLEKLEIKDRKKEIEELVIYELTDGTRTSTDLKGWKAYFDGGLFILRLVHLLNILGAKKFYVLTTGQKHRVRDNYNEIIDALVQEVGVYKKFAKENNIKLRFIGDLENMNYPHADVFKKALKGLEKETRDNKFELFVLIDYSSEWATHDKEFQKLPNANVIVKHTKGQVNEGLWLPTKLQGNSFVYAQNGSMSSIWSDKDLIFLIASTFRSMLLHKGQQYGKSYKEGETEYIRRKREDELSMVYKKFSAKPKKRIVMFGQIGPEIYEF